MIKDIYCLPGTMCDQRLWQSTQQALGQSLILNHVPIPMLENIDVIVAALYESLPKYPINLLGFSMGGYLACAFAIKYPQRVKRLMVLSNTGSGLLETDRRQREIALNWVAKQGYKGIPKKKAMAMLSEKNSENSELIEIIQAMDATLGERVFIQQLKSSLDRPELLPELLEGDFPLSFVVGNEDSLLSADVLEKIRSSKLCTLHTLNQSGHMLTLEQPVLVADLIKSFYS